ncbi:G-box-binding factor 1-like [Abrus precatorius]|uniref:G-box-binding factor 1-like n=1 Tax=Abrus precatorius TaxID=3816 RepID=A0A8B8LX39_ABRPR|nr:G-box-binding factor 1-like [Abrus precatorius]
MGTEKSNTFGTPYNMVPEDGTLGAPQWTTSMQAYNGSESTPIPILSQHGAGSYMSLYMWPYQASSTLLQSDALHDPSKLSSKPTVAGDAALAFSEMVYNTFGEQNMNSMNGCARNLQPESLITDKSRENENESSTPQDSRDVVSRSATNGSKGSQDKDRDTNNDFPSAKKLQSNSTELNHNFGTGLNASGTNAQLAKLEKDEIRKERKRQSNRESAKRSRIRKEKECDELHNNIRILKDENSLLTQRLVSLSEDCMELCNENDFIEEQLVEIYGPESIADLLPLKPASVTG